MRNIEYGIACVRPAPTSPIIPMLFDKYLDFIDVYAGVQAEEREALYRDLAEKEETAMLAQYIKNKGFGGYSAGYPAGYPEGHPAGVVGGNHRVD